MNISDEAVEAAKDGYWVAIPSGGHTEAMRAALDAAAPHMLAQAWDEGCSEGLLVNNGWEEGALDANPYRSQA